MVGSRVPSGSWISTVACPPSTAYRVRKFVRRHRAAVASAALMLMLLLAGTAGIAWQAVVAHYAEQDARAGWEEALTNEGKANTAAEQAQAAAVAEANQRRQAEAVAALLESVFQGLDPKAATAVDAWLEASAVWAVPEHPLFPAFGTDRETLTDRPLSRRDVLRRLKRRLADAGLGSRFRCHSFRATGITLFLKNGGSTESAQRLARHRQLATTQRYDHRADAVAATELDRIIIPDIPTEL